MSLERPRLASHTAPAPGISPDGDGVRLSEVVAALSHALDITEGQPEGHAVRSTLIGMRIAQALQLGDQQRSDLFYTLLLKDLGCSSNSARLCNLFGTDDLTIKRAHKLNDWANPSRSASFAMGHVPGTTALHRAWQVLRLAVRGRGSGREMVETRCERGADIARLIGLSDATATAIRALDEHWDGHGLPDGLSGSAIPLLARIACLAQTVEVFLAEGGHAAAYGVAHERRGTWFDPELVEALATFEHDAAFWDGLRHRDLRARLAPLEPEDRVILLDAAGLDRVAEAFARVVDAKSPYTARHSEGVARIAIELAQELGLTRREHVLLRRAALLHDIGKLGVSNLILDKPGRLDDAEVQAMRHHPRHTLEILSRVRAFAGVAEIAARHHERIDGRGYHVGLAGHQLTKLDRLLAVADVCEALSAERPYRQALPPAEVRKLIQAEAGRSLCPEVVEALEGVGIRHDVRGA
jgi:putative nucleotidyltransferase with HDIG domain